MDWLTIIQIGGPPTAMTILFLYFIDKKDKRAEHLVETSTKRANDIIDRNNKAWNQNTKATTKLTSAIEKLNGGLKEFKKSIKDK